MKVTFEGRLANVIEADEEVARPDTVDENPPDPIREETYEKESPDPQDPPHVTVRRMEFGAELVEVSDPTDGPNTNCDLRARVCARGVNDSPPMNPRAPFGLSS